MLEIALVEQNTKKTFNEIYSQNYLFLEMLEIADKMKEKHYPPPPNLR